MSIITKIDSIPVFTTKTQALSWGRLNGFVGYREQVHFGKKGYIAGQTNKDVAFHKYPAQTATVSLAFKNQKEAIASTSYGDNAATSYVEEISSGGYGGSGKSGTPEVQSGSEGDTGGGR